MKLTITSRKYVLIFVLISGIGVCSPDRAWVVTENGAGPLRIGMSLAKINKLLNQNFSLPEDKEEQSCFYVDSPEHPGMAFMIMNGRLARIDVSSSGIFTSAGVQVGDSEERTLKAYGGRMQVEPHHYTEGHYLTTKSATGHNGIRFETDEGKIVVFYAGSHSTIQLVEGCQ